MLYKTTIVIWSEADPSSMELSHLAQDAESGGSFCSRMSIESVDDPYADEHPPSPEFFYNSDEEE